MTHIRSDELAWMDDALCAETDIGAFFPQPNVGAHQARKICAMCEVKTQCLEYALADRDAFEHGVWGGTTPSERKQMMRSAA